MTDEELKAARKQYAINLARKQEIARVGKFYQDKDDAKNKAKRDARVEQEKTNIAKEITGETGSAPTYAEDTTRAMQDMAERRADKGIASDEAKAAAKAAAQAESIKQYKDKLNTKDNEAARVATAKNAMGTNAVANMVSTAASSAIEKSEKEADDKRLNRAIQNVESGAYGELAGLLKGIKERPRAKKESRAIIKGSNDTVSSPSPTNNSKPMTAYEVATNRAAKRDAARRALGYKQAQGFREIAAQRAAGKDQAYNRLQNRKSFAKELYTKRFDPNKSDEKSRKEIYDKGESMGLSPSQVDSFTQKYLNPQKQTQRSSQVTSDRRGQSQRSSLGSRPRYGSLKIGRLGARSTSARGELRPLEREAERARRKGYGKVASELYGEAARRRAGLPNIVTQDFKTARDEYRNRQADSQRRRQAMMDRYFEQQLKLNN